MLRSWLSATILAVMIAVIILLLPPLLLTHLLEDTVRLEPPKWLKEETHMLLDPKFCVCIGVTLREEFSQ